MIKSIPDWMMIHFMAHDIKSLKVELGKDRAYYKELEDTIMQLKNMSSTKRNKFFNDLKQKKQMKKLFQFLYSISPFPTMFSIFTHDAHSIVSKRGWQVLQNKKLLHKILKQNT